ncbi:MAG: hypothetical protein MUQ25_03820 [Candidatus Aminicenantes bacterium]|nr:hypothetical protein [Candidatus Aminicenantes bacterium]
MAILLKTKSGGRHFLKGDKCPTILNLMFDTWWNPFHWSGWWVLTDFMGGKVTIKISQIESMTPVDDKEVQELIRGLAAQSSKLAR